MKRKMKKKKKKQREKKKPNMDIKNETCKGI